MDSLDKLLLFLINKIHTIKSTFFKININIGLNAYIYYYYISASCCISDGIVHNLKWLIYMPTF
jgi:hypothetical protein